MNTTPNAPSDANDCTKNLLSLASGLDIRADANVLTDDIAARIGYAFAHMVAERFALRPADLTICLGRDSRASGVRLVAALLRGINAAGCGAIDCGLSTTPAMFFTCISPRFMANGAIMVTGSHEESAKNGFKFLLPVGHFTPQDVVALLEIAQNAPLPETNRKATSLVDEYAQELRQSVIRRFEEDAVVPLLGLHVVVDAGNGSGGFYAGFLKELGANTSGSINLDPDGAFPAHSPNPEDADALRAISRAVVRSGADLGVVFDPDCDRAAIVDAQGRIIHRDRLIALVAAIWLEEHPGATIITDSVTGTGLTAFINEWGGVHYRYKRGSRYVIEEARRLNAEGIDCPIAIETSGHCAFRDHHFLDDGMYLATWLICEALKRKRRGETLSSLIEDLKEPAERKELRIPLPHENAEAAVGEMIRAVLSHTLNDRSWKLAPDNREGVRILFDLDGGVNNAWFLLRKSVHDPVLVLNAESDVPGGVRCVLKQLLQVLKTEQTLDLKPLERACL